MIDTIKQDMRDALGFDVFAGARDAMSQYKAMPLDSINPVIFSVPFMMPLQDINIDQLVLLAQECHDTFYGDPEAIINIINDQIMEDLNNCCGDVYKIRMLQICNLEYLLHPILPQPWFVSCFNTMFTYSHLKHDAEFSTHIVGIIQKI